MARSSIREQDQIVVELTTSQETMDEDEFDELYERLDPSHQNEVNDAVSESADNAIGDEHWDYDE